MCFSLSVACILISLLACLTLPSCDLMGLLIHGARRPLERYVSARPPKLSRDTCSSFRIWHPRTA